MNHLNICLIEPEIPQNTGNIARTCAVTGASLHLVKPLGFRIDSAKLKRAGLDYWDKLDIHYYDNTDHFLSVNFKEEMYFFSQKGRSCYADIIYPERVFIVFGKESSGLSEELLASNIERTVRIPMLSERRCLNLSNSVAIAAYEILRQKRCDGLQCNGKLTND